MISYADTKKALKLLKWKSKYSLSDACNMIINNHCLGGVNIEDSTWLDIDTPDALNYINNNRNLFE